MDNLLNLNELEQFRKDFNSVSPSLKHNEYDRIKIELIQKVPYSQRIYLVFPTKLKDEDLIDDKLIDIVDVEFIPHCDNETCDLGQAQFACSECNTNSWDYGDLWWCNDSMSIIDSIGICECEWCNTKYAFQKTEEYNKFKMIRIK